MTGNNKIVFNMQYPLKVFYNLTIRLLNKTKIWSIKGASLSECFFFLVVEIVSIW